MSIIKVNSVVGKEILINTSAIRMVIPESGTRSTIVFTSGERIDVNESLVEIEAKLND